MFAAFEVEKDEDPKRLALLEDGDLNESLDDFKLGGKRATGDLISKARLIVAYSDWTVGSKPLPAETAEKTRIDIEESCEHELRVARIRV